MTEEKELRGADIVARSLARLGCARVFTLSGNHIMSIFDAAIEAKLDLVHVRHEAAAVHMADAGGRLPGRGGVARGAGGRAGRVTPTRSARSTPRLAQNPRWCCSRVMRRPGSLVAAAFRKSARPPW